jgi:hypothetical protein
MDARCLLLALPGDLAFGIGIGANQFFMGVVLCVVGISGSLFDKHYNEFE